MPTGYARRLMGLVLTGVVLGCGLVLVLVWAGQRRLIYFPFGDAGSPALYGLTHTEEVTFPTSDGLTLHGWFVAGARRPASFSVVVFNGNAGNRGFRVPLAAALGSIGLNVLLFDYRGFGGNPGSPTEAGLQADAEAAVRYLRTRPDVDSSRIVLFGESLGSAVAVRLAAEQPPAALILRSPLTSMIELGQLHYPLLPVRWLLRDRYASIERIGQVSCPVLMIAGDRDAIVPLEQTRRLHEAAAEPKALHVIRGADHNDLALLAGEEMIRAVDEFLRSLADTTGR